MGCVIFPPNEVLHFTISDPVIHKFLGDVEGFVNGSIEMRDTLGGADVAGSTMDP